MNGTVIFVVTPCFNAAETIDRTIASVVGQAGAFRIRYHVQDGGSTDGTLQILAHWKGLLDARTFPIQCAGVSLTFDSTADRGMYDALVRGFGTLSIHPDAFMTWINADDILMPGAFALIKKVEAGFPSEEVAWLGGAVAVVRDDAQIVQLERPLPTRVVKEGLCDGKHWDFVQQEGVFFRNWLWSGADPQKTIGTYRYAGDWNLWRVFAHRAPLIQVPWPLGAFRLRKGQLSQQSVERYRAEIESTIDSRKRTAALRTLGDSGGVLRRLLETRYPGGELRVVEKSADEDVTRYYQKNFNCLPARASCRADQQAKRVLLEAAIPGVHPSTIKDPAHTVNCGVLKPAAFSDFTYAKRSHWKLFIGLDAELFGGKKDPDKEQLKVYQDLLVLKFIKDNIPEGARILDVGGGRSRILTHLARSYECWNVDKLEGIGNGPRHIENPPYRLVMDYMGNFNPEIPDDYFDLVFSISALEHVPQADPTWFDRIVADIQRVLRPGAYSLHLFDVIFRPGGFWTNRFTDHIFDSVRTINKRVPHDVMRADPDLYVMSEEAYHKTWFHTTKRPYSDHGFPSSMNILWKKQ